MSDNADTTSRMAALEATVAELRAQVQQLEDDREIRQLIAKYAYTIDTVNADGFRALFTDDSVMKLRAKNLLDSPDQEYAVFDGKDGIEKFIGVWRGPKAMHVHGGCLLTDITGDEATANSYNICLQRDGGAFDGVMEVPDSGNSQWEFRRVDGHWLIKERRASYLGDGKFDVTL